MSLISEALRKARRETAGRGEDRRELMSPTGWNRPSSPAPLGTGLVLGAAIALAAALAGAAAVWWLTGRTADREVLTEALEPGPPARTEAPSPAAAEPAGAVEGAPFAEGRPEAGVDLRAEPPAESSVERTREGGADDRSEFEAGRSAAGDTGNQDRPPDRQAASSSAGPPREGAPRSVAGPRVFVVDADLGRITLSLDFIAFRPDDPFAEINGLEVHVGSRIEGLVVEEIARDHVRLSGDDGEIILRVR